jgi:hypothetical protein
MLGSAGQADIWRADSSQPGTRILRLLRHDGAWQLGAVSFTPFLTAVIHCMQLWLPCHHFNRPLPAAQEPGNDCALNSLIREVCDHYPVNTSRGPVAELSYWRLLAGYAKNDVVTYPAATISLNLAAVYHLHVSPVRELRAGLQILLA